MYTNNNYTNCITFARNSEISSSSEELVKLVPIANNLLNTTLFQNQFVAPSGYKVIPPQRDGSFKFGTAVQSLNVGILNSFRNKSALLFRESPFFVDVNVEYHGNYNTNYCFEETSTFHATCTVCIHDLGTFLDRFVFDSIHPICVTDVQNYLNKVLLSVVSEAVSNQGYLDQRFIKKSFNSIGLFIIGNPVIRDFASSKAAFLESQRKKAEKLKEKTEEARLHAVQEGHSNFQKALPSLYTELTKSGLTAQEIQRTINDFQNKVNQSMRETESYLAARGDEAEQSFQEVRSYLGLGGARQYRRQPRQILPQQQNNLTTSSNENSFKDKIQICRTCGKSFIFSAGEQEYFAKMGFPPRKICKNCKSLKKAESALPDYTFG